MAKSIVVVYVDRSRLQFYGGGVSGVVSLDIPPTVIRDLDVVNRDGFYTLVKEWVRQKSLGGVQVILALSPTVYFEEKIAATNESERETEILGFYDRVPFEELTTKVIGYEGGKLAFATNRSFIDAMSHAFILQGCKVIACIPVSVLGSLSAKRWMDADMAEYILKHLDALKQFNVLTGEDLQVGTPAPKAAAQTGGENSRVMVLVGIFGLLLLALVVIVLT